MLPVAELLRSIHHDMGAPVRHVHAFSRLLAESLPELDEEQDELFSHLQQSAALLSAMMNRLNLLARLLGPSERGDLASEVLTQQMGVNFDGSAMINCDRWALGVALRELVENAQRYGRFENACLERKAGEWCLLVRESESVLTPAAWEEACKPFNRLGQPRTPEAVGLGLTLAVAAMQRMDGRCSREDDGVCLRWPAQDLRS